MGRFIEERCAVAPGAWVEFRQLFTAYEEWCEGHGEEPAGGRKFGADLTARGHLPDKGTGNVSIRKGISVRSDHGGFGNSGRVE